MEILKNICAFCLETTSVICAEDSETYFYSINKDTFNCAHFSDLEFKKLFMSKCLCIPCAHKVNHITNLINHIINNTDNYFTKNVASKKQCNWCHENGDNFFTFEKSPKVLQNMIALFVKTVTKKNIPFKEWQLCINCYFCIMAWKNIKDCLLQLTISSENLMGNGNSSSDESIATRTRNMENSLLEKKKLREVNDTATNFNKNKVVKTDSDSETPKKKKRNPSPEIVKSKTPKIRMKLLASRTTRSTPIKKITRKRKSEDELVRSKLKHLKTVKSEISLHDMNLSSLVFNDRRMMFDIAYVKIDLTEDDNDVIGLSEGSLSESETEIVIPSTSKAPTKPPIKLFRKKIKQTNFYKKKANEIKTRNAKAKCVTFSSVNEAGSDLESEKCTHENNENEGSEDNLDTLSKRNTRNKYVKVNPEPELKLKKNTKTEQKKMENKSPAEKVVSPKRSPRLTSKKKSHDIMYTCSICSKDFVSRCEHKLHEFQHNIPFSPIVLLDNIPLDSEEVKSDDEIIKDDDEEVVNAKNEDTKKTTSKKKKISLVKFKDQKKQTEGNSYDEIKGDSKEQSEENVNGKEKEDNEEESTKQDDSDNETEKISLHDDDLSKDNEDTKDEKEQSEVKLEDNEDSNDESEENDGESKKNMKKSENKNKTEKDEDKSEEDEEKAKKDDENSCPREAEKSDVENDTEDCESEIEDDNSTDHTEGMEKNKKDSDEKNENVVEIYEEQEVVCGSKVSNESIVIDDENEITEDNNSKATEETNEDDNEKEDDVEEQQKNLVIIVDEESKDDEDEESKDNEDGESKNVANKKLKKSAPEIKKQEKEMKSAKEKLDDSNGVVDLDEDSDEEIVLSVDKTELSPRQEKNKEKTQEETNSDDEIIEIQSEMRPNSPKDNMSSQVSVDTSESDEKLFKFDCNLDISDVISDAADEEDSSQNIILQVEEQDFTVNATNKDYPKCVGPSCNDSEMEKTKNVSNENHSDKYEIESVLEGLGA